MSTQETTSLKDLFDQCWEKDSFLAAFLADPATLLLEYKLMDVRGMDVEIVENKKNGIHLIFHGESPDKIHVVSQRHPRMEDHEA